MITRWADIDDLPYVFVLYIQALRELDMPHDEQKAMMYVMECYNHAPCVLLEADGDIVGFAGLRTVDKPWGGGVHLEEYMFYVLPQRRGMKSWRMLCKAVQDVSDRFQLPFYGRHMLQSDIKTHERMIKAAGAKPVAFLAVYGGEYGR